MKTKILLSIKPEYAEKILSGKKQYEIRRKFGYADPETTILLYATKPIQRIVGKCKLGSILVSGKEHIWEIVKNSAGITKEQFMAYLEESTNATALELYGQKRFQHQKKIKNPPQSWRYT